MDVLTDRVLANGPSCKLLHICGDTLIVVKSCPIRREISRRIPRSATNEFNLYLKYSAVTKWIASRGNSPYWLTSGIRPLPS
jgi:hypothetical protein